MSSNSTFKITEAYPHEEFQSIDRRIYPFYFETFISPQNEDTNLTEKIKNQESFLIKFVSLLFKDHLEEISKDLNQFYLPLLLLDNDEPAVRSQVDPLLAFCYRELNTKGIKNGEELQSLFAKDLIVSFLHFLMVFFGDDPQIYDLEDYYQTIRLALESSLGWTIINGLSTDNTNFRGDLNAKGRVYGAGLIRPYLSGGHSTDQNEMARDAMRVFRDKLTDRLVALEKHRPSEFDSSALNSSITVNVPTVLEKHNLKRIFPELYKDMADEEFDKVVTPTDKIRVYTEISLNDSGYLRNSPGFNLPYSEHFAHLIQTAVKNKSESLEGVVSKGSKSSKNR